MPQNRFYQPKKGELQLYGASLFIICCNSKIIIVHTSGPPFHSLYTIMYKTLNYLQFVMWNKIKVFFTNIKRTWLPRCHRFFQPSHLLVIFLSNYLQDSIYCIQHVLHEGLKDKNTRGPFNIFETSGILKCTHTYCNCSHVGPLITVLENAYKSSHSENTNNHIQLNVLLLLSL